MFNIGPVELMVLAVVALVVLGPDKLPGFARDAARMLKTLRELATGARQQLRDELGPEFADVDLRNLNPRTAITRAVFGDEPPDLQKYNPRNFDLRASARGFMTEDEDTVDPLNPTEAGEDLGSAPISMSKGRANGWNAGTNGSRNGSGGASANGARTNGARTNGARTNGARTNGASVTDDVVRPRPRPRPAAPPAGGYDAT